MRRGVFFQIQLSAQQVYYVRLIHEPLPGQELSQHEAGFFTCGQGLLKLLFGKQPGLHDHFPESFPFLHGCTGILEFCIEKCFLIPSVNYFTS